MDDIKVIDNLIPSAYQDAIENMFLSADFNWHYVSDVTDQTYKNTEGYVQHDGFAHVFIGPKTNSPYFDFIKPVLYQAEETLGIVIDQKKLWRARAGFLMPARSDSPQYNNEHVDHIIPHYTGLYYVNDNDGPTYIFDQMVSELPPSKRNDTDILNHVRNTKMTVARTIDPKKGRFVLFNGLRFHSSSMPTNGNRIVITFNWR
jgi:hypothetical protein